MANGVGFTFVHETLTSLMETGMSTKDNDTCSALLEWLESDTCIICFGMPALDIKTQNDGTFVSVTFTQPYHHPSQPEQKLHGTWEPRNTYFDSRKRCLCTEFFVEIRGDDSSSDDGLSDIERSDDYQHWLNN
tara:strand:+ start:211 stop:609 length:399 start_codon:yes stop_codon:yes gene_type:complete